MADGLRRYSLRSHKVVTSALDCCGSANCSCCCKSLAGCPALVSSIVLPACLTDGDISDRCRLLCSSGSGSSPPYRARNLRFCTGFSFLASCSAASRSRLDPNRRRPRPPNRRGRQQHPQHGSVVPTPLCLVASTIRLSFRKFAFSCRQIQRKSGPFLS
jgi:hypothetical protein